MQKNKIDVVKAVCSSAVKKLAVLSLAVAVSSSAVANAQMSEKDAKKQLSAMSSLERLIETNGDEDKRKRLNALNSDIEKGEKRLNTLEQQLKEKERQFEEKERQLKEKEQQLEEKDRQLEEKKRQLEEKNQQAGGTLDWISMAAVVLFLQDEIINLEVERRNLQDEIINLGVERGNLLNELTTLQDELIPLLQQRNALRAELEEEIPEAQRDQAELMDFVEVGARRQNRPVHEVAPRFFTNLGLPQESIQNIMSLFGYENQQQNQRQQYFGGMLNPLNWSFLGGSSK